MMCTLHVLVYKMKCISFGIMIFAVISLMLIGAALPFGHTAIAIVQTLLFLWWVLGWFVKDCETVNFSNLSQYIK